MTTIERLDAWPARVLWVVLALVAAGPVGDALDGRTTAVRVVALVLAWGGWSAGLVALLVPRNVALTVLRIVVPAGVAAVLVALAAGAGVTGLGVAAVAVAAVAAVAVFTPWVGETWVDGSSYGPEHRLPLRPPPLFALVIAPVTWAAVVAGATVGPLLLAAGQWLVGGLVTVIGGAVTVFGGQSLHQLSRRWVVLVPSGLVLHDGLTMPEPQLFLRHSVARLGPALAGTEADDLTAGASGLALQLDLTEPVELLVRTGGRSTETRESTALLFTPSRPRRLLDAAAKRRIPVG